MALYSVIQFWSSDHQYGAIIESLIPNGYFVTYDGWGNREEAGDRLFRFSEVKTPSLEASSFFPLKENKHHLG